MLLSEWQPRITRRYSHEKNVSDKKAHFSLTLMCANASTLKGSKSALLSANCPSCNQPPRKVGHRPEASDMGSGAPVNMKELYLLWLVDCLS